MMTTVSDLRAALMRMVQGGWVVADSLIYLLSRDGEQLRPIGELVIRGGKKKLVVIQRAAEDGETMTVGELLFFCHGASDEAPVKMIADGFGAHVPKGYIYAAMAFSTFVEILNILSRRARRRREKAQAETAPRRA